MPNPIRRPPRVAAPWLRTRLRAAPGAALALAVLVAVTACLAAAFPRALGRYEDAALRHTVDKAPRNWSSVQLSAPEPYATLPQAERERLLNAEVLAQQYARVRALPRAPLTTDPGQSTYGVRTKVDLETADPWLPRPSELPARMSLVAQAGLAEHARLRGGRLPHLSGPVTARTAEVEGAVTAATARTLHIEVGSVIHVPALDRGWFAVRITGIVEPLDRDDAYWSYDPLLHEPLLVKLPPGGPDSPSYWLGALLLPPEAGPALLGTTGNPYPFWRLTPRQDALHHQDLDRLRSAVGSLVSGPDLRTIRGFTSPYTDANTKLDRVLGSYDRLQSAISPLIAVAVFGTGTVVVVVLMMAGGLAADRRRTELALLRARGASLSGLTVRLLAETAVVAVPAGALGLAAALLVLPDARALPAALAALAVTVLACVALPLRAAAAHRVVRLHAARQDVTSVRPSRRRTVAELTLVVIAAGAVEALRRQGTSGDQLVSAAPVLVGVIAALVLVRLYPLPLRGLARPAGRLRGFVAHLSLARAGRTSASAVLPLLALLTALTTAAFGGSVLAGVDQARDRAALLEVGADARIESITYPLATGLADRVGNVSGVRNVTAVSVDYQGRPGNGRHSVPVVGVDPARYADLARETKLGAFPAGELAGGGRGEALPALASQAVAERYGRAPFEVALADGSTVTVRITLVRAVTPAVPSENFLVVDRAGLATEAARPTALLVSGEHADGDALRRAAGSAVFVRVRAAERARYADSPLQSGTERLYAAAVAAGAGYAVLALMLALLRTAPERGALLARLRTMGLTRAQGRRLLVLESLPQAALAALGGVLTGWAAIRLLSPGLDLTVIALPASSSTPSRAELHTDPLSLTVPALAVIAVTVGVAAVQAWWSGRRGTVRELRVGDGR
ncbi:ABC transporter permease [Streptomyces sp. bgisy159]|uniref:ABC transporter permease n=1 Tax=Streptomyces sp. bgisy159 TaxID=3413795 RepID=UPI003F4A0397